MMALDNHPNLQAALMYTAIVVSVALTCVGTYLFVPHAMESLPSMAQQGGTATAVESWNGPSAWTCCTETEAVPVVAAPAACSIAMAKTPTVSAPGPSGLCTAELSVKSVKQGPVLTALGVQAALYVDLLIEVRGDTPTCDGSFLKFRVFDESRGGKYQVAFHYWNAVTTEITSVKDALKAPKDAAGRTARKTIVLPAEGTYMLEVAYKHELFTGMLDPQPVVQRQPEFTLEPPMSSAPEVVTTVKAWIKAPQPCFRKPAGALGEGEGCPCRENTQYKLAQPGYWRHGRREFVPFYHPRLDVWNKGNMSAELADEILTAAPGGILVMGTSRGRTYWYDMVGMLGMQRPFQMNRMQSKPIPRKAHENMQFGELHFMWHNTGTDWSDQLKYRGYGRLPTTIKRIRKDLKDAMDVHGMCFKESHPGVIIFSAGSNVVSRTLGPQGLHTGLQYITDELRFLNERCAGTGTVVLVAAEMALHDTGLVLRPGNSYRDNRNVALNEAVAKAAAKFKMPFIDMYGVSSAGGRSTWADDHVHYYHEKQKYAGDAVSQLCARIALDGALRTLKLRAKNQTAGAR